VTTGRTIEPITAILALRVRESLLLFALGAHAIHLATSDVVFKKKITFCTNLGLPTMIGGFAARNRANKDRAAGVTPVLAASHLLTNRTFFHQNTSRHFICGMDQGNRKRPNMYNPFQHKHFVAKIPVH
jgi:hypothetical protein